MTAQGQSITASTPTLSISPATGWIIPAVGGSRAVTVTTNLQTYTVLGRPPLWMDIAFLPGTAGFTLTARQNTGAARSATITVRGAGVPDISFTVSQQAAPPTLSISPATGWIVPAVGGTRTATVTTNLQTYTVLGRPPLWMDIAFLPGTAGFALTARENTGAARSATITVRGAGVPDISFTVSQQAAPPRLTISQSATWIVPAVGGTRQINVTTNLETYTVRGRPTAWMDIAFLPGTTGFVFTARPNPGAARSATITVIGEGVPDRSFTVTQEAGLGSIHPGGAININGGTSSIGYRAMLWDINGFVTHAHDTSINDRIFFGGTQIGTILRRGIETDASFVRLLDNVSMSNINPAAQDVTVSASLFQHPLVGNVVKRISEGGSGSATVSSGEITHVERYLYLPYHGYAHVLTARYDSALGDSGGIMVHWNGSMWQVAGITVAKFEGQGLGLFTHSVRINNNLGIVLR